MKILFFLLIIATTFFGCQKKEINQYKTVELKTGFPEILKPIEKNLPFKIFNHSILESKNDSIDIYFGVLKQGNKSGNWVALASNGQLKMFNSVDFKQKYKNEKDNVIDIGFNNSVNRVSLLIKELDTINNKIIYSWMNQSNLTDSLIIQTIDRPLLKGKAFPNVELTNINGEKLDLNNLREQTIIFNWWAVWCAPCRQEIPGLNKLVDKYSNDNVKFISITDDSLERVSKFLQKNEFKYDITFISENDRIVFGNSYPKNIVIDSTKTITFYREGGSESVWQDIDKHLTKLVDKE